MNMTPLARIVPRPRHRRAYVTDALYGDRLSFAMGGLAIAAAASLTAWRSELQSVWVLAVVCGLFTAVRLLAFELFSANRMHAERHPRLWRTIYAVLGVSHLTVIGLWPAVLFYYSSDALSEILALTSLMAYLIGTQGRNFASLSIVRIQLLAGLLPVLLAFTTISASWAITFAVFAAFFYSSVVSTSTRIGSMFNRAIETADENWHLAHCDPVTGVANNVLFRETANAAIADRIAFTLHHVDLDRFKRVLDLLGTVAGEMLLQETAKRLREAAGPDCLVARGAGDTFLVFELGEDNITPTGQRFLEAISQPVLLGGVTMPCSCTIGSARFPSDGSSLDLVLHRADMALKEAKSAGGYRAAAYHRGTLDVASQRLHLETALRRAVETNALEMFFQPIVETGSFSVSGCEALMRWQEPERGWISPGIFLPLAEDAGLMNALTEFSLRAACSAAASWPLDLWLSVNLSPSQLDRPDVVEMIEAAARHAGFDLRRLEIEITENLVLEDRPDVRARLERIRDLGVRLSLDDFGTGYSNLVQIALLPLDKIKLDRSFLKNIDTDPRRAAVLRGAVQFIAPLGLQLVLEGIETPSHVAFAVSQPGITHLQGFHFARPMSSFAVQAFLERSRDLSAFAPVSREPHLTAASTGT